MQYHSTELVKESNSLYYVKQKCHQKHNCPIISVIIVQMCVYRYA